MDATNMFSRLFEISPLVGAFALAIYMLWNANQKKEQTLMDTMKAHADDRKESQEKVMQIVNQNSVTNLQLSASVDGLSKSVADSGKDVASRLAAVEQKVDRNSRAQRATVVAKA